MFACLFYLMYTNYLWEDSRSSVSQVIFTRYFGQHYELHVTETTHTTLGRKKGECYCLLKLKSSVIILPSDIAGFRSSNSDVKGQSFHSWHNFSLYWLHHLMGSFHEYSNQHLWVYTAFDFSFPIIYFRIVLELSTMYSSLNESGHRDQLYTNYIS